MNPKTIKTNSPEETIEAGKGIAQGYGVSTDDIITSPTFIIVNEYQGRSDFFHIDLYRIKRYKELEDACIDDYFRDDSVVLIEWADRFPQVLPKTFTEIKITRLGETERQITIEVK
jgi:tRNA threonylcarbamoyladenosine biosynthesis protein TsaE